MKMIKILGLMLAVLVMCSGKVFALDYSTLTESQRASVDKSAAFAGYSNGESYYNARILAELAAAEANLRAARIHAIHGALYDATEGQLTQIEAILNP
jgi:hypothetical protein